MLFSCYAYGLLFLVIVMDSFANLLSTLLSSRDGICFYER